MVPGADRPQRRSIRLQGYDYAQAGAYFVTICTLERACLFGEVVGDRFIPNEFGGIVAECWDAIPDHFPDVELDAFAIMPNHVHGVLVITAAATAVGATQDRAAQDRATHARPTHASPLRGERPTGPGRRSVGAIVGSFKSAVTKRINEARRLPGTPIWQRNYYEHVIRNERALDRIRAYIADNPRRWGEDDDNPGRTVVVVGATHASPGLASPGRASAGHASPGFASPGLASPGLAPPGLASPDQDPTHAPQDRATHASPLPDVAMMGNAAILQLPMLAFFCSVKCPGGVILQIYDLAVALREAGATVVGGFQAPMERECFAALLRGRQPIVVCPARGIAGMRLPAAWQGPLTDGRLLILSPFGPHERRPTVRLAQERNALVAGLAAAILVAHATPGGKTEQFCRNVLAAGKRLLTLDHPANAHLISLGAQPMRPDRVQEWRPV